MSACGTFSDIPACTEQMSAMGGKADMTRKRAVYVG